MTSDSVTGMLKLLSPDGYGTGLDRYETASSGTVGNFPYGRRYNTDVATPPLTATDFSSAVTAISAAFGDPTRRAIYLFARDRGDGVTAAEVAEQFDLHPNVARHHLDKLTGGGYLEVTVARAGRSGAGRPSKCYRATAAEADLGIPVRHDDLLVMLLGRALSMIPADQAALMAEQVGYDYGRLMAKAMGDPAEHQRSFQAAMSAVADALTAHGFAAHAEKRNNELRIVSEHCPFGDAVRDNPVICAVDRGLVRGMLGEIYGEATTELETSMALGGDVCVTTVEG
jgi:predicted ArsR family transcriptional regulator